MYYLKNLQVHAGTSCILHTYAYYVTQKTMVKSIASYSGFNCSMTSYIVGL